MKFTIGIIAALLVGFSNPAASDSSEIMLNIMKSRDEVTCHDLGREFILSKNGFHDARVRDLTAACYTAKSRLHLFGDAQPLITKGTRVHELPIRIIAEETGLSLDPYAPLSRLSIKE